MLTPSGDAFRLDLFDKRLATAHHGLVVADTGSGKSVSLGALTLDALAAGVDAILIDNGNSWKPLTELMGGTHIPVDIKTSISPFQEYARMVDGKGELDNENISDVVSFLEVCVNDRSRPGFDKVETDFISRAIRRCYEGYFREHPGERPLISAFREAIASFPSPHPDDKRIAEDISRRLAIFCDGLYADFLNRPSKLRFDARLLTFDLQHVSKSPATKAIAMAAIIQAITHRAAARRNRTLVEVDEGHEHLGADDVGERFLAGCYRKMRKYDVAMWMISQRFGDFLSAKAGDAIVGNSKLKLFLRHDGGHDAVIDYFKMPPRAAAAFRRLSLKAGHYSDLLLMYGQRTTTLRLALHPLAYWILTTDPEDRRLLERAVQKNPTLDRLTVLEELAAHYPHGALRARSGLARAS
jgi:type IV secretory pathway VirB4 component